MAFILAFSTIMLQTNLHNPAIKDEKRMTKEQFLKQNKGISPDGELSDELLSEIYDRIQQHPISLNKDDIKVVIMMILIIISYMIP
jgi:brefeldin A-inhibited guanine nucleotide-exchange protein